MSYWKWLRTAIIWRAIKDALTHPYAEYIYGLIASIVLSVFALSLALSINGLYLLLLLGLIPTILVMLHGIYRDKMRGKI